MESQSQKAMKRALALALMDIGAVLTAASDHPLVIERQGPRGMERGFKLKLHEKNPDAPLSPFFLNLRTPDNPKPGPLTEGVINLAACCMQSLLAEKDLVFDTFVGVPRAGDPFAEKLAFITTGKGCAHLDKYEHDGHRKIIVPRGAFPASVRRILGIDDLITKADSKIEMIEAVREESVTITDFMVLVDREQGGRKELAAYGCKLHSVFDITELLGTYVEVGRMKPTLRDEILKYLSS